jgi:hypothetical protein
VSDIAHRLAFAGFSQSLPAGKKKGPSTKRSTDLKYQETVIAVEQSVTRLLWVKMTLGMR